MKAMIDAPEPMMAEHWTETETLTVLNGETPGTLANFQPCSEPGGGEMI